MPDNGDDPLSSEDLIRKAKERLEGADEETPPTDDLVMAPAEEEQSSSFPEEPTTEKARSAKSGNFDYDRQTHSTPPILPSEPQQSPWYNRGWVRAIGGGAVALGFFLFNSGVFDPPPEEQFLTGFREGVQESGLSDSNWECIEEGLRADGYVDELAELDESVFEEVAGVPANAPMSDYPPAFQHFSEGVFYYMLDPSVGCLSPSEIEGLTLDFSDPESAVLVELLTPGCENGSLADCDMLFWVTEVGSSAENVALTCGGRNEPLDANVTTCVINYQSDPDLQVLVDECGAGFYLACDVLYTVSIIGSAEETLAASCGGQRDPEYVLPCNTAYGYGTRG